MSKEKTPHVHAEVIHAFADGAQVQQMNDLVWDNTVASMSSQMRAIANAAIARALADGDVVLP